MSDYDCPCGSGKSYACCCGVFHAGAHLPETAEELMRSRYTAYTLGDVDYIEQTMRGPALNSFNKADAKKWCASIAWIGLAVHSSQQHEDHGEVTFVASFRSQGQLQQIKERSAFERIEGKWYYIDQLKAHTAGRNDPCPCGSGKKYKKCCAF